jgi:hypothetical protein
MNYILLYLVLFFIVEIKNNSKFLWLPKILNNWLNLFHVLSIKLNKVKKMKSGLFHKVIKTLSEIVKIVFLQLKIIIISKILFKMTILKNPLYNKKSQVYPFKIKTLIKIHNNNNTFKISSINHNPKKQKPSLNLSNISHLKMKLKMLNMNFLTIYKDFLKPPISKKQTISITNAKS